LRRLYELKSAVQISGGGAQLLSTTSERSRESLIEHPLDRDHLHFLRALVDYTTEASQLKDCVETIDLENLSITRQRIKRFPNNGTWSKVTLTHNRTEGTSCATGGKPLDAGKS
jgi:hypothetical protein